MYPDFLCIGAQKSGTTWLDANLRAHPDIWLPPAKELHYFDCRSTAPWGLYYPYDEAIRFNLRRIGRQALGDLLQAPRNLPWYLRYFCRQRTDHWYASLFTPAPGQLAGEITPGYARLEAAGVERIHRLMPDLKIIYLLRNPIDRLWSQAAMYFAKRGRADLSAIRSEELMRFLQRPLTARNSAYARTLAIWEQYYPGEQLFVGFFEQIEQAPQDLLADIHAFLGIRGCAAEQAPTLSKKIYAGSYPPMPDDIAAHLGDTYRQEIEGLHRRFENPFTASWLAALDAPPAASGALA